MPIESRTQLRAVRDAVAGRLATLRYDTELPVVDPVFGVRYRWNGQRVFIDWYGAPDVATVTAAVSDLLDGAEVVCNLTLPSACGRVHEDELAAWREHEGADELETQCGCGSFEGCEADDDNAYECRMFSEAVLTEERYDELAAAGETFTSACRPGPFVTCADCGGYGRLFDPPGKLSLTFVVCPSCEGRGQFALPEVTLVVR